MHLELKYQLDIARQTKDGNEKRDFFFKDTERHWAKRKGWHYGMPVISSTREAEAVKESEDILPKK